MDTQEQCVNEALVEGFKYGAYSLAASTTVILGACQLFPRFNRALSVSSRTALIISPAIGAWALYTELSMNECTRQRRHLLAAQNKARREAAAS